ncbi:MAG: alpha-1,2-fucosyltransferase [Candidatus Fonsibacter ubiquis]
MIQIKYEGRLGNKMFQYAAAYILSKKHNQKIESELPGYPCKENKDAKEKIYTTSIQIKNDNYQKTFNQTSIDSNLILNDYFQTSEFVNLHKKELKQCFDSNEDPIDGTIIHYRIGDLIRHHDGKALTKIEYFEKCLQYIKNKDNIYITTDSPEHENIKYLVKNYNMEIINKSPADTIKFSSRFKNKILSLGTFSWWIGFLGNKESNVFCPIQKEYVDWLGDIYVFENWKYISYK